MGLFSPAARKSRSIRTSDVLSGESYDKSGDEIRDAGLYVNLGAVVLSFLSLETLVTYDKSILYSLKG